MRLLPSWRFAPAILPIVGGPTRAVQGRNDLGGGVIGKLVGEGHGESVAHENKSAMPKIELAKNRQCRHNAPMSKPKKFWSKAKAQEAVEECQRNGWRAGIKGITKPYYVDAIGYANERRVMIRYDLHDDGHMHEYSRKEVVA